VVVEVGQGLRQRWAQRQEEEEEEEEEEG